MSQLTELATEFLDEIYQAKISETPRFYHDHPDLTVLRLTLQGMHQQTIAASNSPLQGEALIAAMSPLVEAAAELLLVTFGDNGQPTEKYGYWMGQLSNFRDAVVADIMESST